MKKRVFLFKKSRVIIAAMAMNFIIGCSATATAAQNTSGIGYLGHLQDVGWQGWKYNGQTSGTTGQNRQMEAIRISLENLPGGILYRTHVQDEGWQSWKTNGATSGTTGKNRQIEAIQIKLTGPAANTYDVLYRTHLENFGWQSWKKNGAISGTTGQNRQIEAIQIKLVAKVNIKTTNTTKTITYNFSSLDQWKKVVSQKERELIFGGRLVTLVDGSQYYTGNVILDRKIISYKKVKVRVSYNTPGYYKNTYIKLPYKVKYTLHKHKLNNTLSVENIAETLVGLVNQQIRWTQNCSCGKKVVLTWDIPDLPTKINIDDARPAYTTSLVIDYY